MGEKMDRLSRECIQIKKIFSRIGWALSVILIMSFVLQVLWALLPERILGENHWMISSSWGMWLGTFAPMYLIAVPAGLLLMRKLPAEAPQSGKLGGKNFIIFLLISFALMYGGNLIGTVLAFVFSGGTAENALESYAMDSNPLKILVMVILAPVIEEYIFRKQILDRTRKYGEKLAVFFSALTFALFHTNLFQFFYAFGLGWLFAYIYLQTGRLRYPVLIHSIVNFFGSVVAPFVLSLVDLEVLSGINPVATSEEVIALLGDILPGLVVYMFYATVLMGLSVAGFVMLMIRRKRLVWQNATLQLPKGATVKTVYRNVGMIVFVLLCLGMIVISLL